MNDPALLKTLITRGQAAIGERKLVARDVKLPRAAGKLLTITGIRRCGKSSLMRLQAEALVKKGVDRRHIVFLNLEDDRLEPSHTTLDQILRAYRELHPEVPLSKVHFFLDEVQAMPRWDRFVLRLHEEEQAPVMVTGSNANVLAKEIATTLRGRSLNIPLMPFSFSERLRLRGLELDPFLPKGAAKLANEQRDHLQWGGFPEVIGMDPRFRYKLLQEYFDVMLFRDLLERYGIVQPVVLKHFLKRVLTSATKPTSVRKMELDLRSAGVKITKDLLYEWMDHAQAVHLIVRCEPFGAHARERLSGKTKYYATDNGLLSAMSFNFQEEWGRLLENAVAVEAVRQGAALTYFQGKYECDFILLRDERPWKAVQACWDMGAAETRKRELAGLVEACKELGLKKGLILTADATEELKVEGIKVQVRPFREAETLLAR